MAHLIVTFSDINCNNFDLLCDLVGDAGYAGCLKLIDETTRELDLGSDGDRYTWGIKDKEIAAMLGSVHMFTSISVKTRVKNA